MFVVIEFTNYRKEQEIIVHGYSLELPKAVEHAKQLCNNQKSYDSNDYIFKIEELDESYDQDVYIVLKDTPKSKVLHKFFMTQIERTTEKECNSICNSITEVDIDLKKNDITLNNLLDYFEVSDKVKNKINNDYHLDEQIGHDIDVQKYLIDLIKMNNYGTVSEIMDYDINFYSQVFGVVQVEPL